MKTPEDRLPRWAEQDAGAGALPRRAATLVAAARPVPPLDRAALARIKRRALLDGPAPGFARRLLATRAVILVGLLLGSVATATGTIVLWKRHASRAATLAPTAPPGEVPLGKRAKAAAPIETVPAESAPRSEPAAAGPHEATTGAEPPARPQPRARAIASANPPATRGPALETAPPLAAFEVPEAPALTNETEARLLAQAIGRLRQGHDPRGALDLLDRYDLAFPHGVLGGEALLARIEATLAVGDRPAALALLDGRRGFSGRLGADLLLMRAELRASHGRYAEAVGDFDDLLRRRVPVLTADSEERALYGRAVTLGHIGQAARARADLVAYRQRFPGGRFATEVHRLLIRAP